MLEKVHELRDLIDDDQWDIVVKKISPEMISALRSAFGATTQEDVERHVGVFTKLMKASPMKAFGLYRVLDKDQKSIVLGLMEG